MKDISTRIEQSFQFIIQEAESILKNNNKFDQELIYPVFEKASKKYNVKQETLYRIAGRTLTDLISNTWR